MTVRYISILSALSRSDVLKDSSKKTGRKTQCYCCKKLECNLYTRNSRRQHYQEL